MKLSNDGVALLKKLEGCSLKAYKDTAGILTIGYGHAYWPWDSEITQDNADRLLATDVKKFEKHVEANFSNYLPYTQYEFDALVLFAFNLGSIKQLTANQTRDRAVIAEKMLLYCNSGGKRVEGLVKRRLCERDLFLDGVYSHDPYGSTYPDSSRYENIAKEVLQGRYGNGNERIQNLSALGYDPKRVQGIVNRMLQEKSFQQENELLKNYANLVIMGEYGNGEERRERLEQEGVDYKAVQKVVNQMLGHE